MGESVLMSEAPPSLPPELWNFVVICVISFMVAWMVRLSYVLLTYADLRHAVRSEATLYLRNLGPSLSVLEDASMWHFQQLLRINMEVKPTPMQRVVLPFEMVMPALRVVPTPGEQAPLRLSFKFKAQTRCFVQVYWEVQTEALSRACNRVVGGSGPVSPAGGARTSLRRLSVRKSLQNASTLHKLLSPSHWGSNRRFRLKDSHEENNESPSTDENRIHIQSALLDESSYRSKSSIERYGEGDVDYQIAIPLQAPPMYEEERSLHREIEHDGNADAGLMVDATDQQSTTSEPRYAALVVVGVEQPAGKTPKAPRWRPSFGGSAAEEVIYQCWAIDLLPTPVKAERFCAAVAKALIFTTKGVYTSQEIFGREVAASADECVICLEGARDAVLLPCRHFCVCTVCLDEIDRCPICRTKFSTYVCYAPNSGTPDTDSGSKVI